MRCTHCEPLVSPLHIAKKEIFGIWGFIQIPVLRSNVTKLANYPDHLGNLKFLPNVIYPLAMPIYSIYK